MAGRTPDIVFDKEGLNKHRKYCIGIELQKKLSEDREQRMKHQRNDLIKNKEGEDNND